METFRSDIHGSLMMYPNDPNSSHVQFLVEMSEQLLD